MDAAAASPETPEVDFKAEVAANLLDFRGEGAPGTRRTGVDDCEVCWFIALPLPRDPDIGAPGTLRLAPGASIGAPGTLCGVGATADEVGLKEAPAATVRPLDI